MFVVCLFLNGSYGLLLRTFSSLYTFAELPSKTEWLRREGCICSTPGATHSEIILLKGTAAVGRVMTGIPESTAEIYTCILQWSLCTHSSTRRSPYNNPFISSKELLGVVKNQDQIMIARHYGGTLSHSYKQRAH